MNALNQTSDTLLFSVLIAVFVSLTALSVATNQAAPSASGSVAVAAATSGHS
jgi:hypothetical protein